MASRPAANKAFAEDVAAYVGAIDEDVLFDAMSTLTFMHAQGFLTLQEIEWWAGTQQLKKYELLKKRVDDKSDFSYY